MGNYYPRLITFRQSRNDFPVQVTLGEKVPAWGLSRWAGQGLRFLPPDDEGFTLRGDRQRLVYKGRRRSHHFTILGDTAFEYDCILEQEPENNIISLIMEGAERFDFFRQPDFVKDPFLKGSYAVYKKETLIGDGRMSEGTGKLCHIHRPEIIDSRGRRCWGNLSVMGNELRITIPENFLAEAKYPVIVDPTIGTTTVGSQEKWYDPENNDEDNELNWRPLWFEISIAVNKFLVSEVINGECLAYVYINEGSQSDENRPVIYSDNRNKPLNRLTKEEGRLDSAVTSSKPKGWRSASFKTKTSIPSGSNIWFGVCSSYWEARFDYGQMIFVDEYDYQDPMVIPDVYPQEGLGWYASHPQEVEQFYNYKVSWYFTYTSAQNYVRTLTQGITLTDTRKLTGTYKRSATQTVEGTTALSRFATLPRQCFETVYNAVTLKGLPTLIRSVLEHVRAVTDMNKGRGLTRNCTDTIQAGSETKRSQGFYRKAYEGVRGTDTTSFPVLFLRSLPETVRLTDSKSQRAAYIRGLQVEAASVAETRHGGEYYRKQADTVQAAGMPFRSLLIFVRLVTTSLIRDFILRRFLKSNEELVLKSPVCRELTLESTIH
jgi:hypothetical protein